MFDWLKNGKATQPRKGMPSPELDETEFKRRFLAQFADPCFEPLAAELRRTMTADGTNHRIHYEGFRQHCHDQGGAPAGECARFDN